VRNSVLTTVFALALSAPALASNGGTGVPDTGSGGVVYGQAVRAIPALPVLRRFALDPRRVVVRVDRNGAASIRVSLQLRRGRARRVLNRTIRTWQPVAIALPRLGPGRWAIRLSVTGLRHVSNGRIVVRGVRRARPKRAPRPRPTVRPVVAPPANHGVFPVAGPHGYGDGVGARRKGHVHEGQDITAAQGTPVVAPLAGTILYTGNQPSAAG
jgi:murein DD-endopeptidase MepM/ murein hydrolase activator NlpD